MDRLSSMAAAAATLSWTQSSSSLASSSTGGGSALPVVIKAHCTFLSTSYVLATLYVLLLLWVTRDLVIIFQGHRRRVAQKCFLACCLVQCAARVAFFFLWPTDPNMPCYPTVYSSRSLAMDLLGNMPGCLFLTAFSINVYTYARVYHVTRVRGAALLLPQNQEQQQQPHHAAYVAMLAGQGPTSYTSDGMYYQSSTRGLCRHGLSYAFVVVALFAINLCIYLFTTRAVVIATSRPDTKDIHAVHRAFDLAIWVVALGTFLIALGFLTYGVLLYLYFRARRGASVPGMGGGTGAGTGGDAYLDKAASIDGTGRTQRMGNPAAATALNSESNLINTVYGAQVSARAAAAQRKASKSMKNLLLVAIVCMLCFTSRSVMLPVQKHNADANGARYQWMSLMLYLLFSEITPTALMLMVFDVSPHKSSFGGGAGQLVQQRDQRRFSSSDVRRVSIGSVSPVGSPGAITPAESPARMYPAVFEQLYDRAGLVASSPRTPTRYDRQAGLMASSSPRTPTSQMQQPRQQHARFYFSPGTPDRSMPRYN